MSEILYTVKYKLKNQLFWRTIKNVKGDLVAKDIPVFTKIFIKNTEEQILIPLNGTLFQFSKERFFAIKQNMEKESGQKIVT